MAVRLPYLKVSKQGFFTYRRRIPDALRATLGKREILVSLNTTDIREAQVRHAKAHSETESLFATARAEAKLPEDIRFKQAVEKLRRAGIAIGRKSFPSDEERDAEAANRDGMEASLLQQAGFSSVDEFSEALDPTNPVHQRLDMELGVLHGSITEPTPTLSLIYKEWLRNKARGKDTNSSTWNRYKQQSERALELLLASMGDKAVPDITRQDAKDFVTALETASYTGETVKKYLGFAKAFVAYAIREKELTCSDKFAGLNAVKRPDEKRKESFTYAEIKQLLAARSSMNDDLADILLLLVFTGARLSEVSGLTKADLILDGEVPFIHIRDNEIRGLKTAVSHRTVPVVGLALECLQRRYERLGSQGPSAPVFPRYSSQNAGATVSAAMGKWLRQKVKITNPAKTIHSIRHTIKDALRETGGNRDVLNMIQGHTAGDVSSWYGTLELLEVKRYALQKSLNLIMKD